MLGVGHRRTPQWKAGREGRRGRTATAKPAVGRTGGSGSEEPEGDGKAEHN